jgi:hypothetical protein
LREGRGGEGRGGEEREAIRVVGGEVSKQQPCIADAWEEQYRVLALSPGTNI